MYRLLYANDFFACSRKSCICVRPVNRGAGRGLVGLGSHRDLNSGQVGVDHKGGQTLGAQFFCCIVSIYRELLWVDPAQMPMATSSLGASNTVLCFRILQPVCVSLLARSTATLFRCIHSETRPNHSPKLNSSQRCRRIMMIFAISTSRSRSVRVHCR